MKAPTIVLKFGAPLVLASAGLMATWGPVNDFRTQERSASAASV